MKKHTIKKVDKILLAKERKIYLVNKPEVFCPKCDLHIRLHFYRAFKEADEWIVKNQIDERMMAICYCGNIFLSE